jgi:hypothetical protein
MNLVSSNSTTRLKRQELILYPHPFRNQALTSWAHARHRPAAPVRRRRMPSSKNTPFIHPPVAFPGAALHHAPIVPPPACGVCVGQRWDGRRRRVEEPLRRYEACRWRWEAWAGAQLGGEELAGGAVVSRCPLLYEYVRRCKLLCVPNRSD